MSFQASALFVNDLDPLSQHIFTFAKLPLDNKDFQSMKISRGQARKQQPQTNFIKLALAVAPILKVTAVGFKPTLFRNGALSHRLRPLGQTVMTARVCSSQCLPYALRLASTNSKSCELWARTHAELPPVDLKSTPLTTRAN